MRQVLIFALLINTSCTVTKNAPNSFSSRGDILKSHNDPDVSRVLYSYFDPEIIPFLETVPVFIYQNADSVNIPADANGVFILDSQGNQCIRLRRRKGYLHFAETLIHEYLHAVFENRLVPDQEAFYWAIFLWQKDESWEGYQSQHVNYMWERYEDTGETEKHRLSEYYALIGENLFFSGCYDIFPLPGYIKIFYRGILNKLLLAGNPKTGSKLVKFDPFQTSCFHCRIPNLKENINVYANFFEFFSLLEYGGVLKKNFFLKTIGPHLCADRAYGSEIYIPPGWLIPENVDITMLYTPPAELCEVNTGKLELFFKNRFVCRFPKKTVDIYHLDKIPYNIAVAMISNFRYYSDENFAIKYIPPTSLKRD